MSGIDRVMTALAEEDSRVEAPAHVERSVMAAWDAAHDAGDATVSRRSRRWWPGVGALAAGIALTASVGTWSLRSGSGDLVRTTTPDAAVPAITSRTAPIVTDAVGEPPAIAVQSVPVRSPPEPVGRNVAGSDEAEPATATVMLIGEPPIEGESMRVVRMRVPSSALSATGLRSPARARAELIDLDVLVGEDGVARAVRVGM